MVESSSICSGADPDSCLIVAREGDKENMFAPVRKKRSVVAAGMALTVGLAGLYQGVSAEASIPSRANPVTVKVILRDFTVSMSQRHVPAGKPIRLVIVNRGKVMHEAVLERAGAVDKALEVRGKKFEADNIAPGTTRTVGWTVPRAGTYQLACHKPGHFAMGMKTNFTVTGR